MDHISFNSWGSSEILKTTQDWRKRGQPLSTQKVRSAPVFHGQVNFIFSVGDKSCEAGWTLLRYLHFFFDNKTHYILNLCANLNQKINIGLHTQITSTQCNVKFKQILSCGVNICEHTVALDVLIFYKLDNNVNICIRGFAMWKQKIPVTKCYPTMSIEPQNLWFQAQHSPFWVNVACAT